MEVPSFDELQRRLQRERQQAQNARLFGTNTPVKRSGSDPANPLRDALEADCERVRDALVDNHVRRDMSIDMKPWLIDGTNRSAAMIANYVRGWRVSLVKVPVIESTDSHDRRIGTRPEGFMLAESADLYRYHGLNPTRGALFNVDKQGPTELQNARTALAAFAMNTATGLNITL